MTLQQLHVTHTVGASGAPVGIVHNLPGPYTALSPRQMFAIGQALLTAALDNLSRADLANSVQAEYQLVE